MTCPPICDSAALRALERHASFTPLMEVAGAAAAGQARLLAPSVAAPVAVFAGPGNNGGDGFVVARHLREWGYAVTVVFGADDEQLPPDARQAWARWRAAGGTTRSDVPQLSEYGFIVDAMFGIGLTRSLSGVYAEWIAAIGRADCPVLALDVPSGLNADTGVCNGPVVRATHTATFIALKPGLLTGEGVDVAGAVSVHDLGIDPREGAALCGDFVTWRVARRWRQQRQRNSHKGSFGTLGIVGGAQGMVGAPLLAGRAALMAGAGKVHVGLVGEGGAFVDPRQPELMLRSADEMLRQ